MVCRYSVHVSYVEIYNEEIRDLLSSNPSKKLEIKGNNGAIQGELSSEITPRFHAAFMRESIARFSRRQFVFPRGFMRFSHNPELRPRKL